MGWSNQNVVAQTVVIEGGSDGLFVYNGTGSATNPPILAITTASTDPFGNAVNPLAVSDSGMPILVYSSTPALGNLLISIAPVGGTDSYGNTYGPGVEIFHSAVRPGFTITTKDSGETLPASIDATVIGSGGTRQGQLQLESPLFGGHSGTIIELNSTSDDGTVVGDIALIVASATVVDVTSTAVEAAVPLQLQNQAGTPSSVAGTTLVYSDQFTQLHTDRAIQGDVSLEIKNQGTSPGNGGSGAKYWSSGGHAQVNSAQAGASGDTNTYDVERLTLQIAQQTVTTSTGSGLQIASTPVGANTYKVSVFLPYRGSANAGTAVFAFTSPATSAESCEYLNALSSLGFGGTGTVTWSINPQSSFSGTFTSPTLSTTAVNVLKVTSIVTFSASGTLAFFCKCGTAGDNVNLFPGYVEIEPVIAT